MITTNLDTLLISGRLTPRHFGIRPLDPNIISPAFTCLVGNTMELILPKDSRNYPLTLKNQIFSLI